MQQLDEFHLPRVTSTNDYARQLLETHGFVLVTAMHQTHGRGRNGKPWIGDHGANIYASFGIRHGQGNKGGGIGMEPEDIASYMARGALSVYDALRELLPSTSFRLKYPNDVLAKTHEGWAKISGVLVEHEFTGSLCVSTIVGIGVNVEQEIFPETINQPCTSVRRLGHRVTIPRILGVLRDRFVRYCTKPWIDVHHAWVDALQLDGLLVSLADDPSPHTPIGVASDGRLIVRNLHTHKERIITDGDTLRYHD